MTQPGRLHHASDLAEQELEAIPELMRVLINNANQTESLIGLPLRLTVSERSLKAGGVEF